MKSPNHQFNGDFIITLSWRENIESKWGEREKMREMKETREIDRRERKIGKREDSESERERERGR